MNFARIVVKVDASGYGDDEKLLNRLEDAVDDLYMEIEEAVDRFIKNNKSVEQYLDIVVEE